MRVSRVVAVRGERDARRVVVHLAELEHHQVAAAAADAADLEERGPGRVEPHEQRPTSRISGSSATSMSRLAAMSSARLAAASRRSAVRGQRRRDARRERRVGDAVASAAARVL